jgi:hypothetical protein
MWLPLGRLALWLPQGVGPGLLPEDTLHYWLQTTGAQCGSQGLRSRTGANEKGEHGHGDHEDVQAQAQAQARPRGWGLHVAAAEPCRAYHNLQGTGHALLITGEATRGNHTTTVMRARLGSIRTTSLPASGIASERTPLRASSW